MEDPGLRMRRENKPSAPSLGTLGQFLALPQGARLPKELHGCRLVPALFGDAHYSPPHLQATAHKSRVVSRKVLTNTNSPPKIATTSPAKDRSKATYSKSSKPLPDICASRTTISRKARTISLRALRTSSRSLRALRGPSLGRVCVLLLLPALTLRVE
jgi:hypothetical protein